MARYKGKSGLTAQRQGRFISLEVTHHSHPHSTLAHYIADQIDGRK